MLTARSFDTISRRPLVRYRWTVLLAALAISQASAKDEWPGATPDCWSNGRVVHGIADYDAQWRANVRIERSAQQPIRGGEKSPNDGYVFVVGRSETERHIRIDAEKPDQILIRVKDAMSLNDVRWINAKLIAGRIWWGQIAISDFIFDVEAEQFIWHESATESSIAMQQYRSGCRQSGDCECSNRQVEE